MVENIWQNNVSRWFAVAPLVCRRTAQRNQRSRCSATTPNVLPPLANPNIPAAWPENSYFPNTPSNHPTMRAMNASNLTTVRRFNALT